MYCGVLLASLIRTEPVRGLRELRRELPTWTGCLRPQCPRRLASAYTHKGSELNGLSLNASQMSFSLPYFPCDA